MVSKDTTTPPILSLLAAQKKTLSFELRNQLAKPANFMTQTLGTCKQVPAPSPGQDCSGSHKMLQIGRD